jgi:hypothetical protein
VRPLPHEIELARLLPPKYQEKVARIGLTLVMDNTLRRVKGRMSTYPSRVAPAIKRGLIEEDGLSLAEPGKNAIRMLDRVIGERGYPQEALG